MLSLFENEYKRTQGAQTLMEQQDITDHCVVLIQTMFLTGLSLKPRKGQTPWLAVNMAVIVVDPSQLPVSCA